MATLLLLVSISPFASGELVQKGGVRISVSGKMAPSKLPRTGSAPVAVTIGGQIEPTVPGGLPQLRRITMAINRHGHLSSHGLPLCRMRQVQPSTNEQALETCGASLVGEGHFSADVKIPQQSPFPSQGKVLAFNGRLHGQPAILAHIYGKEPVPISYVLPFVIRRSNGTFGTILEASLPNVTGDWGFVTGVSMALDRRFTFRGKRHSYLTAACPAPTGFRQVFFPLARTIFSFAGGLTMSSTLTRGCRVRG